MLLPEVNIRAGQEAPFSYGESVGPEAGGGRPPTPPPRGVPAAVAGGTASGPLMQAVRSVSVSTRGHSHMRGLGPQDGLFGGSGAADLMSSVAGRLLTEGSRVRSHRLSAPPSDHQRTGAQAGPVPDGLISGVLAQRLRAPGARE